MRIAAVSSSVEAKRDMPLLTLALRGCGRWGLGFRVWGFGIGVNKVNLRRLFPSKSSADEATPEHGLESSLGFGFFVF
jgi:hypothetical protein